MIILEHKHTSLTLRIYNIVKYNIEWKKILCKAINNIFTHHPIYGLDSYVLIEEKKNRKQVRKKKCI